MASSKPVSEVVWVRGWESGEATLIDMLQAAFDRIHRLVVEKKLPSPLTLQITDADGRELWSTNFQGALPDESAERFPPRQLEFLEKRRAWPLPWDFTVQSSETGESIRVRVDSAREIN